MSKKSNVPGKGLKATATVPVWMVISVVLLVVVLGVVLVYRSFAGNSLDTSARICQHNLPNAGSGEIRECALSWNRFIDFLKNGGQWPSSWGG